jgi:hypothetical protein
MLVVFGGVVATEELVAHDVLFQIIVELQTHI